MFFLFSFFSFTKTGLKQKRNFNYKSKQDERASDYCDHVQLLYVKERIVSIQIEEKGLYYNQAAEVEAAFLYHGVLINRGRQT